MLYLSKLDCHTLIEVEALLRAIESPSNNPSLATSKSKAFDRLLHSQISKPKHIFIPNPRLTFKTLHLLFERKNRISRNLKRNPNLCNKRTKLRVMNLKIKEFERLRSPIRRIPYDPNGIMIVEISTPNHLTIHLPLLHQLLRK